MLDFDIATLEKSLTPSADAEQMHVLSSNDPSPRNVTNKITYMERKEGEEGL